MPSRRSSHCAVGLGNGSVVVTGGYGGLRAVHRLDIQSGNRTRLNKRPLSTQTITYLPLFTVNGQQKFLHKLLSSKRDRVSFGV